MLNFYIDRLISLNAGLYCVVRDGLEHGCHTEAEEDAKACEGGV